METQVARDPHEPPPARLTAEGQMLVELREIRKEVTGLREIGTALLVALANFPARSKAPVKKTKKAPA